MSPSSPAHPVGAVLAMALSSATPASSNGSGITDWLTGIGTIALALVTVVTLLVNMRITTTDRRRADCAQQKAEEAHRRERQQDSARRLLGLIAGLMPHFDLVPGVFWTVNAPVDRKGYDRRWPEARNAVLTLEIGAQAEPFRLGAARAAEQYRELVHLVLTAARSGGQNKRMSNDLRRYALFVRVSMENLVEHGESLDPGKPAFPRLDRDPGDKSLWSPERTPQEWLDALHREPEDPLFMPAA